MIKALIWKLNQWLNKVKCEYQEMQTMQQIQKTPEYIALQCVLAWKRKTETSSQTSPKEGTKVKTKRKKSK